MHVTSKVLSSVLATLVSICAPSSAFAADLRTTRAPSSAYDASAPTSAYDWSGFYAGVQAGYGWKTVELPRSSSKNIGTPSAGLHGGYNFQSGSIVYGIENDLDYSWGDKTVDGKKTKQQWGGSARGRVGYAVDKALIFGTAGLAATQAEVTSDLDGKKDKLLVGWTAGAGVEYGITQSFSLRGQYRYSDYGKVDFGSSIGKLDVNRHDLSAGVTYRF